jgi:shikimate kinase
MKDQIWLIGFSGSGKSRLARPLATALDWQAIDLDAVIEQREGDSIANIFRARGEPEFRRLEAQLVEETAALSNVVVATGGGAVLSEVNREAMKRRGFVVCLDARPGTLYERIRSPEGTVSDRPMLKGDQPLTQIEQMKAERQPYYAQADFIILTDELTPDQVTHQVLTAFREHLAVAGTT